MKLDSNTMEHVAGWMMTYVFCGFYLLVRRSLGVSSWATQFLNTPIMQIGFIRIGLTVALASAIIIRFTLVVKRHGLIVFVNPLSMLRGRRPIDTKQYLFRLGFVCCAELFFLISRLVNQP
jgi:hypothetical protein